MTTRKVLVRLHRCTDLSLVSLVACTISNKSHMLAQKLELKRLQLISIEQSKHFLFAYWVILHAFFVACLFLNQLKKQGIPSVSNSTDPDHTRHFVGPDLGPNCLKRLSADGTSWHRVKRVSR